MIKMYGDPLLCKLLKRCKPFKAEWSKWEKCKVGSIQLCVLCYWNGSHWMLTDGRYGCPHQGQLS